MTTSSLTQDENPRKDLWWLFCKQPVCWFLLFAAAVFGYSLCVGTMETNSKFNDTVHYLELSKLPTFTEQSLRDPRTMAYPLFLKIVGACGSPDLTLLPVWQFAISIVAVCLFFHGLRRIGVKPTWANLIAGAVFLNLYSLRFYDCVLTDSLGLSAVIASIGLLLALLPGREGLTKVRLTAYWISLGLSVSLAYQIRPVYQFLVPLVPVLGVLLLPVVARRCEIWSRFWKLGPGLSALTCIPLVAFCSLRFFTVGAFGLVSFSGVAMSGTSGQFLTPEMVPKMPADMQPLARDFLEVRSNSPLHTRLGKQIWQDPINDNGKMDIDQFNLFYSPIIYSALLSTAMRTYDNDWVRADAELSRFNRFVVNERKEVLPEFLYLESKKAFRYAYGAFRSTPARKPVRYCLLGVCIVVLVRFMNSLIASKRSPSPSAKDAKPSWRTELREKFRWESFRLVYAGLLLPVAYFSCNTLLILAMLQSPLDRTISPGIVFWPMVPLSLAAWFWQKHTSGKAVTVETNPAVETAPTLKQAA